MDLSSLQSRCATRFRDPNNNIITAATWKDYLNESYRDVTGVSPIWPWLETRDASISISSGSRTGSMPADIYVLNAVYNSTDDLLMTPIAGRSQYRDWYPSDDEAGVPIHYHLNGAYIEVFPLPTQTTALKVDYIAQPTTLSSSGDVPAFPAQFHHALVEGALMRAYIDDGNLQQAQVYGDRFDRIMADMQKSLLGPRSDRFHGIDDRWF